MMNFVEWLSSKCGVGGVYYLLILFLSFGVLVYLVCAFVHPFVRCYYYN